jgi:hypothetical protein
MINASLYWIETIKTFNTTYCAKYQPTVEILHSFDKKKYNWYNPGPGKNYE